MLVAGVDEAGRGCVIGPLVVAGVLVSEDKLPVLTDLGVKDSKLLSAKKREALAAEIARVAEKHVIVKLAPAEIDCAVESKRKLHKLNRLEAQAMAKVIEVLKPDVAFVDAADVVEERFGRHIQEGLSFKAKIVAEHKADLCYPVVSAASIIAKVERDRAVAALAGEFGDFGSGYLADPQTTRFLNQWLLVHGEYPECVRKSWKPAKRAKEEHDKAQRRLF
ncbi:MAG: ribonuclease HII [Candidatus Bathyarchaeota archaeon]|nr:ribonuclease HII [Candidatus Bathyarchaeota archaeon]